MLFLQLSLLLSVALFSSVESFSSGPPVDACGTITPNPSLHGAVSQNFSINPNPYSIDFGDLEANGFIFTPGRTYTFSLSAIDGSTLFRGFFVQTRDVLDQSLVGSFSLIDSSNSQLSQCSPTNSGVTHNNGNDKTSVEFEWTAPDTGMVEFRFTVVQVRMVYWANDFAARAEAETPTTAPPPVPPPTVTFIDNTPIVVGDDTVTANFTVIAGTPVTTSCQLLARQEGQIMATIANSNNCTDGTVTFRGLDPGYYRLRIVALDDFAQQGVMRKRIIIPDADERVCSVNLINDGAVVSGDSVTVSFAAIGSTTGFLCRLDNEPRVNCASPFTLSGLSAGPHRLKIKPVIPAQICLGSRRRRSLAVNFTV